MQIKNHSKNNKRTILILTFILIAFASLFQISAFAADDDKYTADSDMDFVEREFTVNEQIFYMIKDSAAPQEGDISAEQAAMIGLEAAAKYFPEESGNYPYHIKLAYSPDAPLLHYLPKSTDTVWLIVMHDPEKSPNYNLICIHPKTEKIIYIYCPKGKPYHARDDFQSPSLSLEDFYYLSDDSRWLTKGLKLIREYDLNEEEFIINFDEESGIRYTRAGEVIAEYYLGNGDNAKKIKIFIDLLTQDLAGFLLYDNL